MAKLMAACACAVMALAIPAPSSAQVSTGRIDASIADSTGAVLPGVTVDISGPQSQSTVTDNLGEAHFLNLAPGTYTVSAKLSGFSDYLNKNVAVTTGGSVPLKISMSVAGVSTQVLVTSDTPVVDTKKMGTSTNISVEELQNIPSSRDPWVVLQTVPGIIVDRVNVGGAESGQQSNYQAKGASGGENTWNIDGIAITDMAALGSTPTYYDFDMFQDMQVSTGGADATSPTPGVQLNMVLKSGTNTPHGSTRIFFENEDMQSTNLSKELAATIGGTSGKGNRMNQYYDTGFELGGPLWKNRLWAWGAYGKTHVDLITPGGAHDRTELKNSSFKANGQIATGIRANYTFFRGDKQKFGRGAGAQVSDESSWNQSGPTTLQKGEGNFVIGNSIFLAARGAHVDGGFQLVPRGGATTQKYFDDGGVARGSNYTYRTDRPQDNVAVDASAFRGKHELKFGFGWRKVTVDSGLVYPGNGIVTIHNGYPDMIALVTRAGAALTHSTYTSAYGGDTWTLNRLTMNLGLRWDRAAASLGAASVAGSTIVPSLLPSLTASPVDDAIVVDAVSPRLGLTYALDENRKTIVRASYSTFASQLNGTAAATISPIQYSGIYYYAFDTNGNKVADPSEILFGLGNIGYYGFDPLNPTRLTTINQIGKYATPRTQEFMFGMDHELMPNFGISSTFTYRYFNHFNWNPRIGVTSADYTQTGVCTPSTQTGPCVTSASNDISFIGPFSTPFYAINSSAIPAGGGRSYEERRGYHQRFLGLEASAVKRMSNRWMARLGFSTNDHREYFDGPDALEDPTPSPATPNKDGGIVVTQTGGSGKSNIYMVLPQYQIVANGMYQARWGVNLGANWVLRQGYAIPYYRNNVPTGDPLRNLKDVLVVDDVTRFRLPKVSSLDARVEKAFKVRTVNLMLDLDIFNITNSATVLGKTYNIRLTGPTGFNQTLEVMNPRILRLGGRINF